MTTNVPKPTFGPNGFVPPPEAAVLAGVIADWQAAFNGALNFTTNSNGVINPTPQGQLAITLSAIIANAYYETLAVFNGVDPAFSSGRLQDGIARIYFLERLPDESTTVVVTCVGSAPAVILAGSLVADQVGNLYYALADTPIPEGGSVDVEFANQVTGPIPCGANSVTRIYTNILGWDTVNNVNPGVLGRNAESTADFEARREAAIFKNSVGFTPSILGAVVSVTGVLDAYVISNDNNYDTAAGPAALVNADISGTTLSISAILSGTVKVGQSVTGTGSTGISVASGTVIVSGSGLSWVVNNSQTVSATNMGLGGVVLGPNELFVAAVGGSSASIGKAIITKKPPGIPYWPGNTTVTVYDDSPQYTPPGVPYTVVYEIPAALPFVVSVQILNSALVPANALELVQGVIVAAFAGTDGGPRQSIGATVLSSRFYAGVQALGPWARVVEILLGSPNDPDAIFTAHIAANLMTVTAVADGALAVGQYVFGPGVTDGTQILSLGSGTGGTGTYNVSASQTVSSESMKSVAPSLFRVTTLVTQVPSVSPNDITVSLI